MTSGNFWEGLEEAGLGIGEERVDGFVGPALKLADILERTDESMFRRDHDVVLLSMGFKYGMSGETMIRTVGNDTWLVDLTTALPVWYRNNKRVGGLSYDTVVNSFGEKKNVRRAA